jgi:hypothetical protein
MASQPIIEDDDQDDILELDDPIVEDDQDQGDEPQPDDEEGEEIVGFADDVPDAAPADTDLVKHLRQQIRERDKRLSEVQRAAPAEEPIVVGDRPKMADFDYDEERFDEAIDAWDERRRAAEKQEAARTTQKQRQEEEWHKVVRGYADKKAQLRYPDVQDAEETAFAALSPSAQSLIAKHADNPALFIYAAGKSPTKLAELARIDSEGDPFAIVKAVTKMEATLQTTRKAPRAPDPDTPVRGRAVAASSVDKQLAKLEAEAEKTGDRTKIQAFKRAQKDAGK